MHQLQAYIKFLLQSSNQHGVHSPFVYNLVTKCFYDQTSYPEYAKLKDYRASLLKNHESISITDFGTGSKVFKSNQRRIKQIASSSGTSIKRAELIFRFIKYINPKNILELGTSLGIATQAMALGQPEAQVTSIEGCSVIAAVAAKQLQACGVQNFHLKTGSFFEEIPKLPPIAWDVVFFDGHHDKDATLNYFNQILTYAHNDSVFIFDDIHWSKGMSEAWKNIKNHPKVTVTIDTFYWGFVFFRKEQAKEDFVIIID